MFTPATETTAQQPQPAVFPFNEATIAFKTPVNARDIAPTITPVGDEQQVHKTKLLEARRRRRKRLAGRR